MDSLIPPINTPSVNPPSTDKPVGGVIEVVPGGLQNVTITPNQSAMLEVLANAKNTLMQSLVGKIQININNQLLEVPVEVKLEVPLKFSEPSVNNIGVKLLPQTDGRLAVKIVAINNESPEKYLFKTETPLANSRPQNQAGLPLINDTGKPLPPVELSPLKISAVLENMGREIKVSSEALKPLIQEFAKTTAVVKMMPQNLPQASETLPKPLETTLSGLKTTMSDFATGKISLSEAVSQIKSELLTLKNVNLPAETMIRPNNNMVMIRNPLAEVWVETPIKIANGLPVMLKIEDLVQRFGEQLISLRPEHLSMDDIMAPVKSLPADNLLKILQPLVDKGQRELAAAVLNRVPDPSTPRMLANLVSYVKATGEHNINRWLGTDVVDKLNTTSEGREVVSKLSSMFVASHQDNLNWRIIEIPVLNGQNLSKIRIAIKKILDEEEKQKSKQNRQYGTRFVVDTSFTRLGSFQFDGYSLVKDKRFDLIIRSEHELDNDFCANMMRIFKNTLHEEGYVGNVKINVKEKFIKICDNQSNNEILTNGIYI